MARVTYRQASDVVVVAPPWILLWAPPKVLEGSALSQAAFRLVSRGGPVSLPRASLLLRQWLIACVQVLFTGRPAPRLRSSFQELPSFITAEPWLLPRSRQMLFQREKVLARSNVGGAFSHYSQGGLTGRCSGRASRAAELHFVRLPKGAYSLFCSSVIAR